jgi:hypothetical protein
MQKAREFLVRVVNFSCGLGVFRVVSPLKNIAEPVARFGLSGRRRALFGHGL